MKNFGTLRPTQHERGVVYVCADVRVAEISQCLIQQNMSVTEDERQYNITQRNMLNNRSALKTTCFAMTQTN